jgi:hypothetical protein
MSVGYYRVKRLISISLILGFGLTMALRLLSDLAIRLFPYRDLPMMPKPFFLFALLPGFYAAEQFTSRWMQESAFYITNSAVYFIAAFSVIGIAQASSHR